MDCTPLKELGCLYANNVLLLVEGGSKLHGAKLEGADDSDWYGLYVEPASFSQSRGSLIHFEIPVLRTKPREAVPGQC